jgi:cytochrome c oxidase subunit I+III
VTATSASPASPTPGHVTPDTEEMLHQLYGAPPGFGGWLTAVNHRQVGMRYIVTAFIFFLIGGIEALLLRIQLAQSELNFLSPEAYNQLFTMHGTTMMFLFATPMAVGVGSYLIPLMIGARDMPFPRMNAFGYWCFLFGGIFTNVSFLFGAAPDGGWFSYVPLTGPVHSPGPNMDFWLLGITFVEFSAILGAIEITVAVVKTRAPGMTLSRIPLFVWSLIVTALMIVFAFPALLVASIFLEFDRKLGTHFYNPEAGGSAILWQHLFWIFGHPEVYIIFLPAAGIVSMVIMTFARRRLAGYTLVAMATVATGFLSFGVWVHHMFTVGLPFLAVSFFVGASVMFAIPNGIQMFAWLATIWTGRSQFKVPFLYVLGFFVIFLMGGLTGVMVAVAPFDWQAHDSYFVVAHFHYVLIGGFVFPIFAGFHYWFPKATGRMLSESLGQASFWLIFIGFTMAFFIQHVLGLLGMPRRVFTYRPEHNWDFMNLISSIGAFVLAFGVLLFLINTAVSLKIGKPAGRNPWSSGSLEWAVASPPRNYNFQGFPVIRDRAPLWKPNTDELVEHLPEYSGPLVDPSRLVRRETIGTSPVFAEPEEMIRLPAPSPLPIFVAFGLVVVFAGIMVDVIVATLVGLVFSLVCVAIWAWPRPVAFGVDRFEDMTPEPVEQGPQSVRSVDWWAMVVFIGVLIAFIASVLFAFFLLRLHHDAWPPEGIANPPLLLALIASVFLGASGVAMGVADVVVRRGKHLLTFAALTTAGVTAVAFIAVLLIDLWRLDFTPRTNAFGSAFFSVAILQVVLMLGGVYTFAILALRAWKGHFSPAQHVAIRVMGLYWYFVVLLWPLLFGTLYIFPRVA